MGNYDYIEEEAREAAIVVAVREIVAKHLGAEYKPEDIKANTSFKVDLGADNLDAMELTIALEKAFDIFISDEEAETLLTAGDVVKYIASKSEAKVSYARDEDLPDLLSRNITVESYYDILENEDHELLFTLKHIDSPLDSNCKPLMYYDGGAHAIFIKNNDVGVICDYVHPGVRGSFKKVKEVLIAEIKDGEVVEEYMVDVVHVEHPKIESLAFTKVTRI